MNSESIAIGCLTTSAPGANANTYPIFNSVTGFNGCSLRTERVSRVSFALKNSHSGTLKAYMSSDRGVNWYQTEADISVSAPTYISGPEDFLVDTLIDFKLDWVNGGSAQTTWVPAVTLIIGDRASGV